MSSTAGDYSSAIFDSGRNVDNLTEINIPSGELSPDTACYWQVRYQDSQGDWSDWSAETGFATTEAPEPVASEESPEGAGDRRHGYLHNQHGGYRRSPDAAALGPRSRWI